MSAQRVFFLLIAVAILLGMFVFQNIWWFMFIPVAMCVGAFAGFCPGIFVLKKLGFK